jgi:hypothetical protein
LNGGREFEIRTLVSFYFDLSVVHASCSAELPPTN